MTRFSGVLAGVSAAIGLLLLGGCASAGKPHSNTLTQESKPAAESSPGAGGPKSSRISVEPGRQENLGQVFRYLGENSDGSAVLTAGLEDRPAPSKGLSSAPFVSGINRLATVCNLETQVTPYYVFVYPEGYEELATMTLDDKVTGPFATTRASFAIGAGTDLFNAFAMLGSTLQLTIIADNLVADAWCGELFLQNAPVATIVEALLKSARVSPGMITIECTDTYLFVRSSANRSHPPSCLNREALSTEEETILSRKVTFRIPDSGPTFQFQSEPATLEAILPVLSQQLGLPVTAAKEMYKLPINIASFSEVSIETAMDLLVRQWPLPRYGYRLENGGLHFIERTIG